jgi:hypothetical protein
MTVTCLLPSPFLIDIRTVFVSYFSASTLIEQQQQLADAKEKLLHELDAAPTMSSIEERLQRCQDSYEHELNLTQMWRRRMQALVALDVEIKPTTEDEVLGNYCIDAFPLPKFVPRRDPSMGSRGAAADQTSRHNTARPFTAHTTATATSDIESSSHVASSTVSHHGSPSLKKKSDTAEARSPLKSARKGVHSPLKSHHHHQQQQEEEEEEDNYSIRLSDISAAIEADKYLAAALHPLKGRESSLLKTMRRAGGTNMSSAFSESSTANSSGNVEQHSQQQKKLQNMVAYVTLAVCNV